MSSIILSVETPMSYVGDDTQYTQCEYCSTIVQRRGLKNHQRSEICQAHQTEITARSSGLARVDSGTLISGLRALDVPITVLRTPCKAHVARRRSRSAVIGTTYWVPEKCLVAWNVCSVERRKRLEEMTKELITYRDQIVKQVLVTNELPEEIKVLDAVHRLSVECTNREV